MLNCELRSRTALYNSPFTIYNSPLLLYMRITEQEKLSIKQAFNHCFKGGDIYLFGSRVNNAKKGGDIDLFIIPETNINREVLFQYKINFLLALKQLIGEQKIDVIVASDPSRAIEKTARKIGILL